jgi:hypothetical protein
MESNFAIEQLGLNQNLIKEVIETIQQAIPSWQKLIDSRHSQPSYLLN